MYDPKTVRSGARHALRLMPYMAGVLLLLLAVTAGLRGVGQTYVSVLERGGAHRGTGADHSASHRQWQESTPLGLGQDADFAYLRADTLLAQHIIRAKEDKGATDQGAAAIREFRRALRLRPVWGRAWARLAQAKAVVGESDSEFSHSLARAMRFAPNEPEVQAMVVWAGLSQWDSLPQPTKQLVWSVVTADKIDHQTSRDILRWAVEFGLSEYLAPLLGEAEAAQLEAFRRQWAALQARFQQEQAP